MHELDAMHHARRGERQRADAWSVVDQVRGKQRESVAGLAAPLAGELGAGSFAVGLIVVSGACAAPYHLQAVALMARKLPDRVRAQVMGLTSTSLVTVQGIGIMLAGVLAQLTGPFVAIGSPERSHWPRRA